MKLKQTFIFILPSLFLSTRGLSEESAQLMMRQSQGWIQVEHESQAQNIYQKILKLPLEPWQRAIVDYDSGYVSMKQEKWPEAIETFSNLLSRKNLSPELLSRLHLNLSLALLGQARSQLQTSTADQPFSAAVTLIPLSLLKEALHEIEEAKKNSCQLAQIEGYANCNEQIALEIETLIKQELSLILKKKVMYQQQHLSLYKQVTLLLQNIQTLQEQLLIWNQKTVPASTSLLLSDHDQNSKFLWQSIGESLKETHDKKWQLFTTSKQNFKNAKNAFNANHREQALTFLALSKQSLSEILTFLPKPSPLVESIESTIFSISEILDQDPIEEKAALELNKEFERIHTLISDSSFDSTHKALMEDSFNTIHQWHQFALRGMKNQNSLASLIFLIGIQQELKRALLLLHQEAESPYLQLRAALIEQRNVLDVTLLADQLTSKESLSPDLITFLQESQKKALTTALPFPKLVIKQQTIRFHSDQNDHCQKKPWDSVMPLFFEGYRYASDANLQIQQATHSLVLALDDQKEAIKKWLLALETLQKEQEPTSEEHLEQHNELKTVQIIQNLQEMEQEDDIPEAKMIPFQTVEKPW